MPQVDPIKGKIEIEFDPSGVNEAKQALEDLKSMAGQLGEADLGGGLTSAGEAAGEMSKAMTELATVIPQVVTPMAEGQTVVEDATEALGEHTQAIEEAQSAYQELAPVLEDATKQLTAANEPLIQIAQSAPQVAQGFTQIQEAIDPIQLQRAADIMPQIAAGSQDISDTLQRLNGPANALPIPTITETQFAQIEAMNNAVEGSVAQVSEAAASMPAQIAMPEITEPTGFTGASFNKRFAAAMGLPESFQLEFTKAGNLTAASQKLIDTYFAQSDAQAVAAESTVEAIQPMIDMGNVVEGTAAQTELLNSATERGSSFIQTFGLNTQQASDQMAYASPSFDEATGSLNALHDATFRSNEQFSNAPPIIEGTTQRINELNDAATNASGFFGSGGIFESTGSASGLFGGGGFFGSTESSQGINKFGGVGYMPYGPEEANPFANLGRSLGGMDIGSMANTFDSIMRPVFYAQQAMQLIGQVATGTYNLAALQEGSSAHTTGSATGSVDAFAQSGQAIGESISEGALKALSPVLNLATDLNSGSGGFFDNFASGFGGGAISGLLGSFAPGIGNLAQIVGQFAQVPTVQQYGASQLPGQIQTVSQNTGVLQAETASPQYIQESVLQQTAQANLQSAQLVQTAMTPAAMAAANQLQAYQGYEQQYQQAYNQQHPVTLQDFQQAMNGNYQQQIANQYGISPQQVNAAGINNPNEYLPPGESVHITPEHDYTQGIQMLAPTDLGGGCFVAGTMITMADGSTRPIESLLVMEYVLGKENHRTYPSKIAATITFPKKQTYMLKFSDGNTLITTDSHPIATVGGWKSIDPRSAKEENPFLDTSPLARGDEIHTRTGTCVLESITIDKIMRVYNITVDQAHTYYANGILVHNAKMGGAGAGGQTELSHEFHANVTWSASNLEKQFVAIAQWAEQGLQHTATVVATWAEQGLNHAATAIATWVDQNVTHNAVAQAIWQEMGTEYNAIARAVWQAENTVAQFAARAVWEAENLVKGFIAEAQWAGENLVHLFVGIAEWVGEGLSHVFTATASFVSGVAGVFADGVENYSGGPAIVGEAGPEVVSTGSGFSLFDRGPAFIDLPPGSSVYPLQGLAGSTPRSYADGTGDSYSPITIGSSVGGPSTANIHVHMDKQTIMQMWGVDLSQDIAISSGKRSW